MPFKSDKQRKACFATDGFGGKVDCEEWAKKSKKKKKMKDAQYQEVSPPGWHGTVAAMKKHKNDIDEPYALAWHGKKKGKKPHYKDQPTSKKGKPKKKEKYKHEWMNFQEYVEMKKAGKKPTKKK